MIMLIIWTIQDITGVMGLYIDIMISCTLSYTVEHIALGHISTWYHVTHHYYTHAVDSHSAVCDSY